MSGADTHGIDAPQTIGHIKGFKSTSIRSTSSPRVTTNDMIDANVNTGSQGNIITTQVRLHLPLRVDTDGTWNRSSLGPQMRTTYIIFLQPTLAPPSTRRPMIPPRGDGQPLPKKSWQQPPAAPTATSQPSLNVTTTYRGPALAPIDAESHQHQKQADRVQQSMLPKRFSLPFSEYQQSNQGHCLLSLDSNDSAALSQDELPPKTRFRCVSPKSFRGLQSFKSHHENCTSIGSGSDSASPRGHRQSIRGC